MTKPAAWPPPALRDVTRLVELAHPLEVEANKFGIFNVFDDGGYRTLLLLEMLGLKKAASGRLGDDARDDSGNTYELKTVNLVNTKGVAKTSYPGVTTEHTLRRNNITRYRATKAWLVGVFKGNAPLDVYSVPTSTLEPFFKFWEAKIGKAGNQEINNPKLPFGFVAEKGTKYVVPGSDDVPRPPVGKYTLPAFPATPKATPRRK